MIKLITAIMLWIAVSGGETTAATITSSLCSKDAVYLAEKCSFPGYEHVILTLTGRITKGDLANLQKEYAGPAYFACLNRFMPGRYVTIPANKLEAWQENWPRSHRSASTPPDPDADAAAEKKCLAEGIPNRTGYVNGILIIDSPGGRLDEAMAIGRWARANRFGVIARGKCVSACVWVLASGLMRNVWPHTAIRVHRPFLVSDDTAVAPGQQLRELLQDSRAYFNEMGVPPELAERMFSTPPDETKTLNEDQISYYRLDQSDMGFQEEVAFSRAKHLGISREEYVKRRQLYNEWNKREPCTKLYEEQRELQRLGAAREACPSGLDPLDAAICEIRQEYPRPQDTNRTSLSPEFTSFINKCMNERLKALGLVR